MPERSVRFAHSFFAALDQLLPESRTGSGGPSATDFLLYDLPPVRDLLAADLERHTLLTPPGGEVRVYFGSGSLVRRFALYACLVTPDTIEVLDLDIEPYEESE